MERYSSTGQSPQRAVAPKEEEEEDEYSHQATGWATEESGLDS